MNVAVELRGGAGNQLFQLCAALTARALGAVVSVDQAPLLSDPQRTLVIGELMAALGVPLAHMPRRRWMPRTPRHTDVISEPPTEFSDVAELLAGQVLARQDSTIILRGYFQTVANVKGHVQEIREALESMFDVSAPASPEVICLHVRRGDYVSNPQTLAFHGSLSIDYYQRALTLLLEQTPASSVLLYSDDVGFLTGVFLPELQSRFPDTSFTIREQAYVDPVRELLFLSQYSAHVIANSSFSWWAATLSASTHVIGPVRWSVSASAPSGDSLHWRCWKWI